MSPTGVGVAIATGSYRLCVAFAFVVGVVVAAHIPMKMTADVTTPKIHFEKFGLLLISNFSLSVEACGAFLIEARVEELTGTSLAKPNSVDLTQRSERHPSLSRKPAVLPQAEPQKAWASEL
jgi:hypothetical protein